MPAAACTSHPSGQIRGLGRSPGAAPPPQLTVLVLAARRARPAGASIAAARLPRFFFLPTESAHAGREGYLGPTPAPDRTLCGSSASLSATMQRSNPDKAAALRATHFFCAGPGSSRDLQRRSRVPAGSADARLANSNSVPVEAFQPSAGSPLGGCAPSSHSNALSICTKLRSARPGQATARPPGPHSCNSAIG